MKARSLVVVVALMLVVTAASAAELPVSRVVLFSTGVGYFQHRGEVDGNASMVLSCRTEQMNDILKSLVLQDLGGGSIEAVTYTPQDPLSRILASFSVPIADNPSLGELARRLRGSEVVICTGPETVRGTILGVEQRQREVDDDILTYQVINLLTDSGIVGMAVPEVQSLQMVDEKLNEELRLALAAIAASRDVAKRDLHLSFKGSGQREVSVGYLLATPVWKTSYRLVVQDEGKLFLQGWAIVENTTDHDWQGVSMALVSGQPVSFRQNLYQPLYTYRPEVAVSVPGTVLPPTYEAAMRGGYGAGGYGGGAMSAPSPPGGPQPQALALARGVGMAARAEEAEALTADLRGRIELAERGVIAAAAGAEVGELFQYAITQPVTIGRQQSAMIPIVNQELEGEKVSLFSEEVHKKHPMNALRLVNTTGLHLAAGAITVFDGGAYAGDALLESLPPGEERFIGYAVDLGVEVDVERASTEKQMTLSVDNGVLIATIRQAKTITYTLKSCTDEPRQVIVQTPKVTDWELVQPEEPAEETADHYRFAVALGPRAAEELVVTTTQPVTQTVALLDADADKINFYLKSAVISDDVKAGLQEIVRRRVEIAGVTQQIAAREARLKEIGEEQARIRKNMQQLTRDSELYKKYVAKLTAQEDEFDRVRAERDTLQEKHNQLTTDLNEYIRSLNLS
ncbi:MAG: hypothetical protein KAW89_08860 [Armatimonadetes bacterium]|nr:hypothetical protein [Armatimonadota bacterium]